jgi:hypothetical protein
MPRYALSSAAAVQGIHGWRPVGGSASPRTRWARPNRKPHDVGTVDLNAAPAGAFAHHLVGEPVTTTWLITGATSGFGGLVADRVFARRNRTGA